jgi:hypothetical protein
MGARRGTGETWGQRAHANRTVRRTRRRRADIVQDRIPLSTSPVSGYMTGLEAASRETCILPLLCS